MDEYWSVDRCGWVPSRTPQDPLATTWTTGEDAAPAAAPDLPAQRVGAPAPAEA